jgi:hypothetical protein
MTDQGSHPKNTKHKIIVSKSFWKWYINKIIVFEHYPSYCFYLKHRTFRRLDSVSIFRWNLFNWAQSTELVLISGLLCQHKLGCINQAQHNPSARVKTNIKNSTHTRTHEV